MNPQQSKKWIKIVAYAYGLFFLASLFYLGWSHRNYQASIDRAFLGQDLIKKSLNDFSQPHQIELLRLLIEKGEVNSFLGHVSPMLKQADKLSKQLKLDSLLSWSDQLDSGKNIVERQQNNLKWSKNAKDLTDQVQSLFKLSQDRKWPRLTRLSEELNRRVKSMNRKEAHKTLRFLRTDLDAINALAQGALSTSDVQLIQNHIDKVNQIIERLSSQLELQSLVKNWEEKTLLLMKSVYTDLEKISSNAKLLIENEQKNFFKSLILFVVLNLLFLFALIKTIFSFSKNLETRIVQDLDHFLRSGVDKGELSFDWGHERFRQDAKRHLQLIVQKLQLGQDFQQGLPLPTFIIGEDLKVLWGNEMFLDYFQLTPNDLGQEFLSWEYLKKWINFGESDPVLQTLSSKNPGTYNMNLKMPLGETLPFEFYITPLSKENSEKMFIMMVPLMFVHETIKEQTDLMKKPIQDILDYLITQDYSLEQLQALSEPLRKSHSEELIGRFYQLQEKMTSERNDYLKLNRDFENFKSEHHHLIVRLEDQFQKLESLYQITHKQDKEVKEAFVGWDTKLKNHSVYQNDLKKEWRNLFIGIHQLKGALVDMQSRIRDVSHFVQTSHGVKKIFKDYKEEWQHHVKKVVAKFPHSIEQEIFMKTFEEEFAQWDMKLFQIDSFYSKLSMMLHPFVLNDSLLKLDGAHFQGLVDKGNQHGELFEKGINDLIETFQEIFHLHQQWYREIRSVGKLSWPETDSTPNTHESAPSSH
jgi:hypothetical protein